MRRAYCCQSMVVLQAKVYSALLRQFYRDLTADYTTSSNLSEKEMDLHIARVIDMEPSDPDTIFDLHLLNSSTNHQNYDVAILGLLL